MKPADKLADIDREAGKLVYLKHWIVLKLHT